MITALILATSLTSICQAAVSDAATNSTTNSAAHSSTTQQPATTQQSATTQQPAASLNLLELAYALAPNYVNEGSGPDAEAVDPLLALLLRKDISSANHSEEDLTLAFERLAPNLQERHTDLIAEGLVSETWSNPELAAELLLAAPYSQARVGLARFALADHLHGSVRLGAVARILEADGRAGLERLRPLLTPESYSGILKRIYFFWGAMAVDDDLPLLEELVRQGPGMCREFALQTWARVETRSEKRLEIFRLSAFSSPSYRSVVVRILASNGPDADLTEHVRSMLSSTRSEDRRLALDILPYVAGPEALLEEYHSTIKSSDSPEVQGRWMVRLCRLELPEARAEAAAWLMDRGWQEIRFAEAVERALAKTDTMDLTLTTFLNREEIPFSLRLTLASGRVQYSEDAVDFMRTALPEAESMHAVRIVQVLAALGGPENIQSLFYLAMDPGSADIARAAAILRIGLHPQGASYLRRLLADAPHNFETAEALVSALLHHGDPDLRNIGLASLRDGFPDLDVEESDGLHLAAWRAQIAKPIVTESAALVRNFVERMTHLAEPFPDGEWPRPRELSQPFGDLLLLAQATAASSPRAFRKAVLPMVGGVPPSAIYVVAEAVLEIDPATGLALASALASRQDLSRSVRIRCLGLVARAAQFAGRTMTHLAALDRILGVLWKSSDPGTLFDLGHGLALSSPRGWLLPKDQILQRRLLANAASQSPDHGRPAALRPLASGGCPVSTLLEAVDLLLVPTKDDPTYIFPSNTFLAEDLCLKAIDFEPGSVRAHFLLAETYLAQESYQEALVQLDEVLRLAPPGGEYAVLAAQERQQLLTTLKEEQ